MLCYKIAFLVLGIGIIFHLILYNSISDIYCNESPIASSISTIPRWNIPAPSTRVVIFLVDCLRAEQLFSFTGENGTFLAPFIAEQSLREGTWGLVSRPMNKFDDTNTMFTGIQPTGEIKGTIPVDSVFNQSSRSWVFGSPPKPLDFVKDRAKIFSASFEMNREALQNGIYIFDIKSYT